jgi:hypothetical protein
MSPSSHAAPLFFAVLSASIMGWLGYAASDPLPPDLTYRPLPTRPFSEVKADDEAQKPRVMQRQIDLLHGRYDLGNKPIAGVMMSGGRKVGPEGPQGGYTQARIREHALLANRIGAR